MEYRVMRNVSLTPEQVETVKNNHGKMNVPKLAKLLGISFSKCYQNLRLLGLSTSTKEAKVIRMETEDGYFNVNDFAKYYQY